MPPRTAMYEHTFMVGYWDANATTDLLKTGGGTSNFTLSDANGVNALLNPQYVGFNTGVNNPFYYFSTPAVQEDTQAVSNKLDAARLHHVVGPWGRYGTPGQSISEQFYNADPSQWTQANANGFAAIIEPNYRDHTYLVGYNFEDDVSLNSLMDHQDAVVLISQAFQDADQYDRPAFFVHLFPNEHNYWADYDCKVGVSYMYACGYRQDNPTLETEEGNFMSARIPSAVTASVNSSHPDYVDWFRYWMSFLPEGAHFWPILQTHDTTGTGASGIRTPTDRELRKMFWIAIGEGSKGIFWFPGDNTPDIITKGIWDTTRHSSLNVISELSQRLTPAIRKILLKCTRVTDQFTVNGGAVSYAAGRSYDKHYSATLQHEDGTLYLVVCNHNTFTGLMGVTGFPEGGYLTNLETGDQLPEGVLNSTLPALDGTIFRFDPWVGVPHKEPNFAQFTVEEWWAEHWANPDSEMYIPVDSVQTWPNEVVVAAGDLQDAIDNSPDYTTFRLEAGTHPRVRIVGREHLHFIADDDGNRPDCHGFDIYGSEESTQYNNGPSSSGMPKLLKTDLDLDARAAWNNPKKDFLFRNIDFVAEPGTTVNWMWYQFDGAAHYNHDHWYSNAAIGMRNVVDVLIEGCTASDYIGGDMAEADGTAIPMSTPPTGWPVESDMFLSTGSPTGHPGVFWGNMGIKCVTIRDTTINGPQSTRGFPYAIFFDGAQGCVFEDITLTGKFGSGDFLFLTNDDYTYDLNFSGKIEQSFDVREAICNVVANITSDKTGVGQTYGFGQYSGRNLLVKNYNLTNHSGGLTYFAQFTTKVAGTSYFLGNYYSAYGNILDNCDITHGTVTNFLSIDADQGVDGTVTASHPYRSHTGYHTIKNCHALNVTGNWVTTVETQVPVDGTTVESNNTEG